MTPRYVTRRQLVERANAEGIPLKESRVDKEAMKGNRPPLAAKFGRQELYEEGAALAWARSLLQPVEPEAA
jgi:hypothetical protein